MACTPLKIPYPRVDPDDPNFSAKWQQNFKDLERWADAQPCPSGGAEVYCVRSTAGGTGTSVFLSGTPIDLTLDASSTVGVWVATNTNATVAHMQETYVALGSRLSYPGRSAGALYSGTYYSHATSNVAWTGTGSVTITPNVQITRATSGAVFAEFELIVVVGSDTDDDCSYQPI